MLYHVRMNTSQLIGIHKAAVLIGSQKALARLLNVTPVTVNQWLRPVGTRASRSVPPKQCVRIEQLTSGAVTRRDLRPNDYLEFWPELAQAPASPGQAAIESVAQGG